MWAWATSSTRNFPMLARFSVIPRQSRQSNSPNIIQSGSTCDASSSIYCCNRDVRTVWVPTGWFRAHSSTLASRGIDPPLSPLLSFFLPPTTFSLSHAPQTSSIPNSGIDHQPECSETAPRPRCSPKATNPYPRTAEPHPTMDLRPRQLAATNDMRDSPLPFSCSFSNSNSNSKSSRVCYSKA